VRSKTDTIGCVGLDVYVGTLARYYSGDWETVVQQRGREAGINVEVRRPTPPGPSLLARLFRLFRRNDTVAVAVARWRRRVERELGTPLTWSEDPAQIWFTDKPAWDCYGALVLWAAYDEVPNASRSETGEQWSDDSAYQTARLNPALRYRHLMSDTELWLPADFAEPLSTKSVLGELITVGSSERLLAELEELNRRTWDATDDTISQWRAAGADDDASLEMSGRFGFSVFYELAKESVRRRLPMKLDY
jgi:hypothetical protein